MKLQWIKDILGDAYTDELDAKVSAALGERFVSRADFNAKNTRVTELETQVGQLEEQAKTHATSLAELKKLTGDNEALTKKIGELEEQAKTDKATYEKELAQVKLLAAVDAELTASGSKNNTAVRAILANFLAGAKVVDGKVTGKVGGENVTLAARIEALKKDATTDFMFGTVTREGWKPGEGGDSSGKPAGGKKPSEMSYAELAEYMAANPDAKLD
jgi:hypothetical protein